MYKIKPQATSLTMAKDLSDMAMQLDFYKTNLTHELKAKAAQCVDAMHLMAEAIAESDAEKIYGKDDGSEAELIGAPEEECHL